ncbi:MAG: type II toxin-antitoxin system RelE/ParE family toxin [Phenylobacterium sp.]|uniref:type II toxin-antitoxin system RelE/ParE family toxin n=1 Tax=Phenylobacterium sp. TaxID=1871053 RepID=UPI003BB632FC
MNTPRRLRLSQHALNDIANVLDESFENFGPGARHRYEALIATALEDLARDAAVAGSIPRPELGDDVRTLHLLHCRDRAGGAHGTVKSPRHLIAYEVSGEEVIVLRLFHDAMELSRHLPPHDPALD